jgi:hypothetical protein
MRTRIGFKNGVVIDVDTATAPLIEAVVETINKSPQSTTHILTGNLLFLTATDVSFILPAENTDLVSKKTNP